MTDLSPLLSDRIHNIRVILEPASNTLLDAVGDKLEWNNAHDDALHSATTAFGDQPTAHAYLRALLYGRHAGSIDHAVLSALGWSPDPGTPMLLRSGTPVATITWPSMLVADSADQGHTVVIARYDTVTGGLHHMEVARSALFVR